VAGTVLANHNKLPAVSPIAEHCLTLSELVCQSFFAELSNVFNLNNLPAYDSQNPLIFCNYFFLVV